jgi:predicted DsbA family dithiol-disulfide isomerase
MKTEIEKDTKEGGTYGVTGTPAAFVNGRFLSGAQPFENFKKIIDDELQMKGIPVPTAQLVAPVSDTTAVKR